MRKVFHFKRGCFVIGLSQTLVESTAAARRRTSRFAPGTAHAAAGSGRPRVFLHTAAGFFGIGVCVQKEKSDDCAYKKKAWQDLDKEA